MPCLRCRLSRLSPSGHSSAWCPTVQTWRPSWLWPLSYQEEMAVQCLKDGAVRPAARLAALPRQPKESLSHPPKGSDFLFNGSDFDFGPGLYVFAASAGINPEG